MGDWADERAAKWIEERGGLVVSDDYCIESLAKLLREVATEKEYAQWQYSQHTVSEERDKLLAEVRRVVEGVMEYNGEKLSDGSSRFYASFYDCGREILSRLEALK